MMDRRQAGRWLVVTVLLLALMAPAVASAQEVTPCVPPLTPRLVIDQQGSALTGLNVRDVPQGEWIGGLRRGATFNIVDGPRPVVDSEGDCLAWWYVYDYNRDLFGWVAEGWEVYWIEPLAVGAAPKREGISDGATTDVGEIGELIRTDFGDVVEWAVWRTGPGYVALGWTWTTPEEQLGCSVPQTGGPLTAEAFCALIRSWTQ